MSETYRVSLAMIVRDEARCITRCLESVRDVVDEMVVVDTGSTDSTVQLATRAGAIVHHFTWVDDFAAARNASLDHCSGDWVLVLDADDWLESGAEVLGSLRSTPPTFAGIVEIAGRTRGDVVSTSPSIRVFPAGTRYAGRIHEQPQVEVGERPLAVRIATDGYQEEQLEKKVGRNQRLLEMSLAEEPENAYLWYQLAREHAHAGAHAAACLGFEQANRLDGPTRPDSPPWRHGLVVQYVASLLIAGRTQDAVDLAADELEHWEHSPDFLYVLGHALNQHALAHPEVADQVLPMAEEAWRGCLALGDAKLVGSIEGHGSHLAARELVGLYERQGRMQDAARVRPLADRQ
ncbi:glycosyltransferase [Nocardioides sp. SR21]|uniref:glycosyltransferase n=1 Tax=Nocardioides sp. SR21 TaxID=2919501 RepID=UPI001FA9D3AF|nr:glycosyltransferase [Nocardioides sp. SR21]